MEVDVRRADEAPWHPGRCAALSVNGDLVGHAGELHPRVIDALDLPQRTCAMELDLDALIARAVDVVVPAQIGTYPQAKVDVALVVEVDVPVQDVASALRAGAGELLESLRLFDVYTGPQVGEGRRSLAFALRLRAPDHTITEAEASSVRAAAVAEAARRTGAELRT
jgi:phenylalanyl-tRNA synthetase beta chain